MEIDLQSLTNMDHEKGDKGFDSLKIGYIYFC